MNLFIFGLFPEKIQSFQFFFFIFGEFVYFWTFQFSRKNSKFSALQFLVNFDSLQFHEKNSRNSLCLFPGLLSKGQGKGLTVQHLQVESSARAGGGEF